MLKTFLLLLLTVASSSAMADWVELSRSEIQTSYANPSNLSISGSRIQLWVLSSYKTPHKYDGKLFFSLQTLNEYNCSGKESRMLEYSLHSGKMGDGEILQSSLNIGKWQAITARGGEEIFWKAACDPATGWVKIGESEIMFVYTNPFTIRKRFSNVKMWELFDLKSAKADDSGKNYLSVMHQAEYDCKENQYRTLAISYYSENMGKGDQTSTVSRPQEWDTVVSGSADEAFWKIACSNPK